MHIQILVSGAVRAGLSETELVDILSLDDDVLAQVLQARLAAALLSFSQCALNSVDVFLVVTCLQYHSPPIKRIPPLVFIRLRDAFSEYLVERAAAGGVVFAWCG